MPYAIKILTVNGTYLKRLSKAERRRAVCPFGYTIKPGPSGSTWVKRSSAERFLGEVQAYFSERWALNGERPIDLGSIYSIIELND